MARFNIEVSQSDFERASWLAMRKGPLPQRLRFYLRIALLVGCIGACLLPVLGHPTGQTVLEDLAVDLCGFAFLFMQFYMIQRGFGRQYRRSVLLRLPATIDIDSNGVHWVTAESETRTAWRIFLGYSEDRWSFVLFDRGSQAFMAIPKRTLSAVDVEELHVVLDGHIPRK